MGSESGGLDEDVGILLIPSLLCILLLHRLKGKLMHNIMTYF